MSIEAKGYAHPEVLVDADWVQAHKGDDNIKLVEVDVDTNAYAEGHIPGAIAWNWTSQLNDQLRRDIPSKEQIENCSAIAASKATTPLFCMATTTTGSPRLPFGF